MNLRDILLLTYSAVPAEYVADTPFFDTTAIDPPCTDLDLAVENVLKILRARLLAVARAWPDKTLGLMLSGGIDSMLVAAMAADLRLPVTAVTVVVDDGGESVEQQRATQLATDLSIDHHVVRIHDSTLVTAAAECSHDLGTSELWEIASAIPVRAAHAEFNRLQVTGPILSGAGSDALFLGGSRLDAPPFSTDAVIEYRRRSQDAVGTNFTRHRLIPDYYQRLLGIEAPRFTQVFQTTAFWLYSRQLHPVVLWGVGPGGRIIDKMVLRVAAQRLGVDLDLTCAPKDPLQVSSGMIGALARLARAQVYDDPIHRTYADPHAEPAEHTLARFFLEQLHR